MMADMDRPTLTSAANPTIKAAARLRDRRERERTGLTIVDGARELRRALEAGIEPVEAFVCEARLGGPDARAVLDRLAAGTALVHRTTDAAFEKVAFGDRSDGLVAVIRQPALDVDAVTLPADPLVVVLEGVEKPGNLGAVLRSADGAGADAVIVASPRTDLWNPNVIRASAGTVFSMRLGAATSGEVLAWLAARGLRIVAARVDAARPYTDATLTGPVAIVLGSEAAGLAVAWAGDTVEAVRLPMHGVADSLNVSVTAAVLLYEARRQRDRHADEAD
jgi:TrmH family RNA methyltransferase